MGDEIMVNLSEIIRNYPISIPVKVAAKFLGMSPASLRAAIDQNQCPFGFSWRLGERRGYKIPTSAFSAWLTKGTLKL